MTGASTADVDPETYVQEHREEVIAVIRQSEDPYARACAWALLDKYTKDQSKEQLHEELDAVIDRRGSA